MPAPYDGAVRLPEGLVRPHPDGVVVAVWVVPGAARSQVAGLHAGALRVRVSAPPEAGKANRAAAELVSRVLGGRGATVVSGAGARRKEIAVRGVEAPVAAERLLALLSGG
jgi:hypothetical protein